jgi:transcriptional regulator with XRE-family HTH domain
MKEIEIRATLGKNIKKYRKQKQISQEKLAEVLDIATNFLSDVENGKKWVSPNTLSKITEALDVEVWQLFKTEQSLPPQISALLEQYTKDALAKVDKSLNNLIDYYQSAL